MIFTLTNKLSILNKLLTMAILTVIIISNYGLNSYAQSNSNKPFGTSESSCLNGLKKFTINELPNFSFCFDSSTQVNSTIRNATSEEKKDYSQITKTEAISKLGEITVNKNGKQLVFKYIEGSNNFTPQTYCTAKNISTSNDEYGTLYTSRRAVVDISPTLNRKFLNEFSQEYNGKKDKENNILYPTDPTKNQAGKLPDLYDPANNAYIDSINGYNENIKSLDARYPFVIVPQGYQLPFASDKDKDIINNKRVNEVAYDITKLGQVTKESTDKEAENKTKKYSEEVTKQFLEGKGNCFDNTHRLFGMRLDSELIINNQHSSGYNINPELDNQYQEVITPNSPKEYQSISGKLTPIPNLINSMVPSIKIYSNSNQLATLADTIESICWNSVSCERRSAIMSRTYNESDNIFPKNSVTKDINGLNISLNNEEIEKEKRTLEEEKKLRDNPYYNKRVRLNYTIHCDGNAEFTGSEIPAPVLKSLFEQNTSDSWLFRIYGASIYKGFPIQLVTEEHYDCAWGGLSNKKDYNTYELNDATIQHIQNFVYKNSDSIKDEDVGSSWADDKYKDDQINIEVQKRGSFFVFPDPRWGNKILEKDEIYARSRIYGEFTFDKLKRFNANKISFKYNDQSKFASFNPISEYGFTRYKNESEKSNVISMKSSQILYESEDTETQIDKTMWVKGDRSNRQRVNDFVQYGDIIKDSFTDNPIFGGNATNSQGGKNIKIVDEMQSFGFRILNSGKDRKNYSNNNNPNVWIISHGYADQFGGDFEKMGNQIIKDHPNDIVLGLDWSNIAKVNANAVDTGSYDICRIPTWIRPISQVIHKRINNWGLKDGSKLRLIGHSLGTIMSAEISQRFIDAGQNQVSKMILLDPPSENRCKLRIKQYTVQSIPEIPKVQSFKDRANYTYSFVGNHSLAGNEQMAITAHRSFWMEYGNWNDMGKEHTAVVATFEKINRSDRITGLGNKPEGFLSTLDYDKHEDFESKLDNNLPEPVECINGGISCSIGKIKQVPNDEEWKLASWEGHYGIIEAGSDTNVNDGDVQWLWAKKKGNVFKILK